MESGAQGSSPSRLRAGPASRQPGRPLPHHPQPPACAAIARAARLDRSAGGSRRRSERRQPLEPQARSHLPAEHAPPDGYTQPTARRTWPPPSPETTPQPRHDALDSTALPVRWPPRTSSRARKGEKGTRRRRGQPGFARLRELATVRERKGREGAGGGGSRVRPPARGSRAGETSLRDAFITHHIHKHACTNRTTIILLI